MSVVLVILDGWGMSGVEKKNAIAQAKTPVFDNLLASYPALLLQAASQEVGLPFGEVGNSEVGHFNLGIGRVLWQNLPMIDEAIKNKEFSRNEILKKTFENARNKNLHLLGLLSNGGVHSHLNHCFALLEEAKKAGVKNVFIHAFTDGRDTPPKEALGFIKQTEKKIKEFGVGQIATVSGRYFALDRDNHWDRLEKVYRAIVEWKGEESENAAEGVKKAYDRKETDEFITPMFVRGGEPIKSGDSVIVFNFRSDRSRQLTKMLMADKNFSQFPRSKLLQELYFATMTPYETEWHLNVHPVFEIKQIEMPLSELLSGAKMTQLHLAETEKYAHVTYFFNGGREKPFPGEKQILIPSPKISTYDLQPEMSAKKLTETFLAQFRKTPADFTVLNFANPDMVGHTGNFQATIKAVETVDECLGKISEAMKNSGANLLITADHGNAEQMENPETGEEDKEHTINFVPLILINQELEKTGRNPSYLEFSAGQPIGILADVAPTIGELLEIEKSNLMTGESLLSQLK